MPRIFDNIAQALLPALRETLKTATHADFCVGYFNLRGWKALADSVEAWHGGEGNCCRLLVGMQRLPQEELRHAKRLHKQDDRIDNQTALRLKRRLAEEFREQLTVGVPTREDEEGLRQLAMQLRDKKVQVKLFLRHPLHAKLYLLHRPDAITPIVGYLGSSNLTFAGLSKQGELNVDVLDADACQKLKDWFDTRWADKWCIDISAELVEIIEQSWAREERIPPYHIYVKMAYHLSQEARLGLTEFQIPREFRDKLFEFQTAAVQIAAHHLNTRGGVLIGDVVGLGKTVMGTALARIFEDDYGVETLIICPKNLVTMWEAYREDYHLRGRVLPLSRVIQDLPNLRRYRLVLIDESHNLRNREGKRYRAIQEYIHENDSRVILLSATPYNKTYLDLSSQLRLFVEEDRDLGIRPERYLRELGGETEFLRKHQSGIRTLPAFEQSEHLDDWRELMRLYLVRRTRSFIMDNYAETDAETERKFLAFPDGTRSYFPIRVPKTVKFSIDDENPDDTYAQLYSPRVVEIINDLQLPRYGLANYIVDMTGGARLETAPTEGTALEIEPTQKKDTIAETRLETAPTEGATLETEPAQEKDTIAETRLETAPTEGATLETTPTQEKGLEPLTPAEKQQLANLSRGGQRLIGFSRTNLFKRLESSGQAFLQSVERHILRNYVYLNAIENGELLPLGAQDSAMLDARFYDEDADITSFDEDGDVQLDHARFSSAPTGNSQAGDAKQLDTARLESAPTGNQSGGFKQLESAPTGNSQAELAPAEEDFKRRAAEIYHLYATRYKSRFKWIRSELFRPSLRKALAEDASALLTILQDYGAWRAEKDEKLNALATLLTQTHPHEKVLIFTQFADTVRYLKQGLSARGISQIEAVTGDTKEPTGVAWRFSPVSNDKRDKVSPENELRVLISTDILSEGQNLQDCAIVVNYDLPWAIIRLVQRAGRVDRIGQTAEEIACYSFLPADGVERIINLRGRVRERLRQNSEIVGTDEAFFEDDDDENAILALYHERAGLLDDEPDTDVDLASYAYQIWKNAITREPRLERIISELPAVVYSTKAHDALGGALVYLRTGDGNDALAWINREGTSVTESQFAILQAAACAPNTEALPPLQEHHDLVRKGTELILTEERLIGGQLGRPSGARFRTYQRLQQYAERIRGTLFDTPELKRAIDDIYRYPLRQAATDTLNRQLRTGITDEALANLVMLLRDDERLCVVQTARRTEEPQIICSLGLVAEK